MANDAQIAIAGYTWNLVSDSLLPAGKRAIVRDTRETNTSDPGRLKRREWQIWGPIGASLFSTSGALGTNYVQNLETRWPRRLISAGRREAVQLSSTFPTGTGTSLFGEFNFGDVDNLFGGFSAGSSGSPGVQFFDVQSGYLFAHDGFYSTQVSLTDWSVIETIIHDAIVQGCATWVNRGRLGMGGTVPLQTRTGVTATGSTYSDTFYADTDPVLANQLAAGSDRIWFNVATSSGEDEHTMSYSFDAFQNAAAPFPLGDPGFRITGIGPFGPFTYTGKLNGLFSFTDQGKPVPLSRALLNHISDLNGRQWADPGWGWNYTLSDVGLRAVSGNIDNPVGIGESMRLFTGHDGLPTAVWMERGELWVAYYTSEGDTYLYRGAFDPPPGLVNLATQGGNGQPYLYPFAYLPDTYVGAIGSTSVTSDDSLTAMFWGEDHEMAHLFISRDGRDDLNPNYRYSTDGGAWFGTTFDADPHLVKTLRLARLRCLGMEPGSSWTLAFAFDSTPHSATYVTIGTVTEDGFHVVFPVSGGVPLQNISGVTITPRLVQLAGGANAAVTPPEVNGTLEVEYDERPQTIEEVVATVVIGQNGRAAVKDWELLKDFESQAYRGPVKVRLPNDLEDRWAMVAACDTRRDIKGDNIQAVDVRLQLWDSNAFEEGV